LGSESETCVGSRVHLVGVSISFEKNFYRLPFTPLLSGSPYRSFTLLSCGVPIGGGLKWSNPALLIAELETQVEQLMASEVDMKNLFYREKEAREVLEYDYK
jgi:hypothetical protein